MKRLAVTALILGLITLQAQAQTTKKGTKSNDGWGSSSSDWGGGWDTPAPKKKAAATAPKKSAVPVADTAPVADPKAEPAAAPAPTAPQASDAAANAGGGFGGGGSAAEARPIEGISVAPGSALRPMSRTRYDYRGRLIESKPSMRPRE